MKRRIPAFLLALAMLLGAMTGCGSPKPGVSASEASAASVSQPEPTAAPGPNVPAAVAESVSAAEASETYEKVPVELPFADGESISMFLLIPPFISSMLEKTTDLTVLGELERRTGLSFDVTAGNYIDGSTEVNLLIASGSYPDIINHADLYSAGMEAALEQEIVIDLYDHITNDMPNLLASLKAYDVDAIKQMTTVSGRIGAFPQIHQEPYIDSFAVGINQDVMEDLQLTVPTTFSELHDLLTTVKDQTGLQYGLSNQGTDGALMQGMNLPIFGSRGTGIEGFRVVDGTVEYGAITDEMRTYLEMVSQWFREGLIYSDFMSYEDFQQTNMVAAGTLFGNGSVNAQTLGEAKNNGVHVTAIPYLTENAGDEIKLKGSGEIVRSQAWSISTSASEDTVELICQLVDYIFSEEGTLLFNYGVEGEGFTLDENGEPQWSDLVMNYDGGYTTAAVLYATATPSEYICGIYDDAKFNFSYTEEQIACQDIINQSSTGEYDFPIGADNVMTTEESSEAAAIAGDLGTYISETALSWICGQSVLDDAAWESYLASCEAMNVQGLIEIYQTVYDRFMDA